LNDDASRSAFAIGLRDSRAMRALASRFHLSRSFLLRLSEVQ
jgi:hypothetical protein